MKKHLKPIITHNKPLFYLIIIFLALFILLIIFFSNKEISKSFIFKYIKGSDNSGGEVGIASCVTDADCIPKECCHPFTCVSVGEKPDCSDSFCTQECAPGTLDCNQGYCRCVEGKCGAVFNE